MFKSNGYESVTFAGRPGWRTPTRQRLHSPWRADKSDSNKLPAEENQRIVHHRFHDPAPLHFAENLSLTIPGGHISRPVGEDML
jgi:hypothetical protein